MYEVWIGYAEGKFMHVTNDGVVRITEHISRAKLFSSREMFEIFAEEFDVRKFFPRRLTVTMEDSV